MNNKNHVLYLIQSSAYNCVSILALGSVFQSFMLESGIGEQQVALYVSVMQVLQTLVMLAISVLVERIKNVIYSVAFTLLAFVPLFVSMLFVSIRQSMPINTKYCLLFVISVIVYGVLGVYNILCYKLPHHVMNIKDYGKISAISGLLSCFIGILFSAGISFLTSRFEYFSVMKLLAVVGTLLTGVMVGVNFFYTPVIPKSISKTAKKLNIFRYKPFYTLLAPNFLRGVSFGIYNLIAVIGYSSGVIEATGAAVLVTVSQVASVLGYQAYIPLAKKVKNGTLCLVSTVGFFLSLAVMLAFGGRVAFYAFYFVSFLFINFINVTIPILVAQHIDYECLGQYTAWRMALYTLGTALGGVAVPWLLGAIGGALTLIVGGALMLPCGIGYYLFEKKAKD